MNLQLLTAMGLLHENCWLPGKEPIERKPKVKKCLQCKKEHTHKNLYCSAKCCKKYRVNRGKGQT